VDINFGSLINSVFDKRSLDLFVCVPAEVVKFYQDTLTADVSLDFNRVYSDGSFDEYPEIYEAPILYPMSSDSAMVFPLKPKDKVIILFAQRDLDQWRNSLSKNPNAGPLFPISSGMVIPGVSHANLVKSHSKTKDGMGIYGKKLFIGDANAKPDPNSSLGSRDLIEMLKVALEQLKTATYPSAVGPAGPMVAPQLTIIEGIIAELGELQT
jgi:hypothetical protein